MCPWDMDATLHLNVHGQIVHRRKYKMYTEENVDDGWERQAKMYRDSWRGAQTTNGWDLFLFIYFSFYVLL